MAVLFDEILTKGVRQGKVPAQTAKARDWYRKTAQDDGSVKENDFFGKKGDKDRMTAMPLVGSMYMYEYSAKHKDTLPYYDRLPLIFPYKKVKGGFYGLNMHYLPQPQQNYDSTLDHQHATLHAAYPATDIYVRHYRRSSER